jgi:hypothetical protein
VLTSTHYKQRHLRGGMSWDGTLGRVTVPNTGHYFVSFGYYEQSPPGRMEIYRNGSLLYLIHAGSGGSRSISFVTTASANDYFNVVATTLAGNQPEGFMGDFHTHFSAYLLG